MDAKEKLQVSWPLLSLAPPGYLGRNCSPPLPQINRALLLPAGPPPAAATASAGARPFAHAPALVCAALDVPAAASVGRRCCKAEQEGPAAGGLAAVPGRATGRKG